MQRERPRFMNPWHFSRTDFRYDEYFCRLCDRFSENEHKPVLYRKFEAVRHEESQEHAESIEKFLDFLKHHPDQLQKYTNRDYGKNTKRDPLFPDEIYESLEWQVPDARFGAEYINQFVEFWISDVAAASTGKGSYPEPEEFRCIRGRGKGKEARRERREFGRAKPQGCQRRRTFAEFFDSLDLVCGEYVFEDGYWVKRKNEPDAEGWVTQIRKTKTKTCVQVERVASQNKFALLQGDDVEDRVEHN